MIRFLGTVLAVSAIAIVLALSMYYVFVADSKRTATPLLGVALDGFPVTESALRASRERLGVTPRIANFYLQWSRETTSLVALRMTLDTIAESGAIPCVTWEPMNIDHTGVEVTIPHGEISTGVYDAYIDAFAAIATQFKRPLLLRFAHEMNLDRYHWGGRTTEFGPNSPKQYQDLFRHVVTRFRRSGASNVRWVFSPNAESVPLASNTESAWNTISAYYPGDEFVDVLGIDGYNWNEAAPEARSFREVFHAAYEELRSITRTKPLIVFETATVGSHDSKVRWLTDAVIVSKRWDIRAIVWFDVDKEKNWQFDAERTRAKSELATIFHSNVESKNEERLDRTFEWLLH